MGRRFARFSTIKGLSNHRRLPRVAKLHLGIKKFSERAKREYPKDVDHFVIRDPGEQASEASKNFYRKFKDLYGDSPRQLDIIIPCEDPAIFFPQAYRMYGSGKGLKCIGDGETANRIGALLPDAGLCPDEVYATECQGEDCVLYKTSRWMCSNPKCEFKGRVLDRDNGEMIGKEVDGRRVGACARCKEIASRAGGCKYVGTLQFILPRITLSGTVQVDTSSVHGIIDLNSALSTEPDGWVRQMFGRVSWLFDRRTMESLLILKREARETHGSGRKELHWPLQIEVPVDMERLKTLEVQTRPGLLIDAPDPREIPEDLYPKSHQEPPQRTAVVQEERKAEAVPEALPAPPTPPEEVPVAEELPGDEQFDGALF